MKTITIQKQFKSEFISAILIFILASCGGTLVKTSTQNQQYQLKEGLSINQDVDSFIKPYRDSLDKKVNAILAIAEVELTVGKPGSDLYPSQVAMGNFVTDAIMEIANQKAKELNKPAPNIGFFAWGSLRKSLPKGEITLRNIFELMPFENEMIVLKLNSAQIKTLIDRLSRNYNPVAGLTMMRDDIQSVLIDGKPIQDNQDYYVLTSDYHAFGGDNMTILLEASEKYLCGIKIRDALALYLQQLTSQSQILKADYEPRIKK